MTHTQSRWLPSISLLLAVLLWASSFIALKLAFQNYDPMVVIFGRMAVASLFFLCLTKKFKGAEYHKGDLKYILFMCFCEPCLYFIFEAKAIENTTASQASMITTMLPLMVAVAAGILLKERVTRQTLTGFIIAILGACWLSFAGQSSQGAPNPTLGNFFEFIAMICATLYTITLKYLTRRYHPFFLTGIQAFVGSIFYLPFLFLPSTSLPIYFEPVSTSAVVYLGTFITLGAYGLYNYAVSIIPASQASAFINLIPVFTIGLGWLILNEQFSPEQYAASVLVFLGVLLSQSKNQQQIKLKLSG